MALTEPAPRQGRGRKRKLLDDPSDVGGGAPAAGAKRPAPALEVPSNGQTASLLPRSRYDHSRQAPHVPVPVIPQTPVRARTVASPSLTPSPVKPSPKHRRYGKPTASSLLPQAVYPMYLDLVHERTVLFLQVERRRWAAQIYDMEKCRRVEGVHGWAVVTAEVGVDGTRTLSCSCPDSKRHATCVHVMTVNGPESPACVVLSEQYPSGFVPLEGVADELSGEPRWTFACLNPTGPPVFVSHTGRHPDEGSWSCSKDRGAHCHHISGLRRHLRAARAEEEETAEAYEQQSAVAAGDCDLLPSERSKVDDSSASTLESERSVAYLPVGPPLWCRLESDNGVPSFAPRPLPDVLPMSHIGRCVCGWFSTVDAPRTRRKCTIYASHGASHSLVEVTDCPSCSHRQVYAGPDLREYGLFNFNNKTIYTHELLNSFTSRITAHELPFHAFVTAVSREYLEHQSTVPFVSDDTFRKAWFSFSRVQQLGDSFSCDLCGPNPRCIIFDGVTAGFDESQITSSLKPPTTIQPGAPVRMSVRPPIESTAAVWGQARQRAQKAVRWRLGLTKANRSAVAGIEEEDDEHDTRVVPDADAGDSRAERATDARLSKRDQADAAMRSSLSAVAKDMHGVDEYLGNLFVAFVTANYDDDDEEGRRPYLELLNQVLAYESVLHLAPEQSWIALHMLEDNDPLAAEVLLREVPAFGTVATLQWRQSQSYSADLRGLATFVRRRAIRVMSSLSDHDVEEPSVMGSEEKWQESGVYYGRPQIRLRPEYPFLPGDKNVDRAVVTESGSGGIGCSKYYEAYGRRGLTGGLMAAWCPHCICLGFHCIPKGEGRNDVFSALYTRWPTAPEVVVYDFACALAHYCMLREPKYFKNTRFVIDGFHAKGHTRCTKACFISNYANDSKISGVNSSAAECGNRGLLKIRRPLSYMSQRRAIIFAYTYLATWNRERRLAAMPKASKSL